MRFLRHISFSNVIALLALFIALGGAAYAGTKINGKTIVNQSIGGGKLKNHTIGARQLKNGSITGTQIAPASITGAQIQSGSIDASQINLTGVTVPQAQAATTASKADSASKADAATTAQTAITAKTAEVAQRTESADTAEHAEDADSATHADTADEATKVGGKTAAQLKAESELTCASGTEFYGGMCWDEENRNPKLWLAAVHECGEAGGRLPTIEELIAYVLREGEQVDEQTWSGDVDSLEGVGKKEVVFTTDEGGRSTTVAGILGFRCVFPQSN
jgi:hypothetical protein